MTAVLVSTRQPWFLLHPEIKTQPDAKGTAVWAANDTNGHFGSPPLGYDIGCGVDMRTSNGVSLTGTAGLTPQIGANVPLAATPTPSVLPVMATPVGGAITVGHKPGIINIVPVDKKEFKGTIPGRWCPTSTSGSTVASANRSSAPPQR